MDHSGTFRVLADLVLVTHVAFVAFVIFGLVLILVGGFRKWAWIRNAWFRAAHLLAIGIVVGQAWAGVICPLTTLEMWLRERAGDLTYEGTFISHWLHRILFFQAPPWVFVVCYTVFGLLVIASWFAFRPRSFRRE